jgi:hypothetical protein
MKSLILAALVLACATPAKAAEVWTCTYTYLVGLVTPTVSDPTLVRFEVSPSGLIETTSRDQYRILQNNEYGLVATVSWSEMQEGLDGAVVGARTLVVNKGTGEFWWSMTAGGGGQPAIVNQLHGTCLKD